MKKAFILLLALALLATACAFVGCGGNGDSPQQVAEGFWKALEDGDADKAYGLLSEADKAEIGKEELVEGFAEGVESYTVGEAEVSGDTARVPMSMLLAGSGIDLEFDMVLFNENGSWKVSFIEMNKEMQKAFEELMQEYEPPE
jgi:hypothetical protein